MALEAEFNFDAFVAVNGEEMGSTFIFLESTSSAPG